MTDGEIINEAIKSFLDSMNATVKQRGLDSQQISDGVIKSLGAMVKNADQVGFAIEGLLLEYSNMCKQGQPAAVRTAKDTINFWFDKTNRNANPDTNFSCGLDRSGATAAARSAAPAEAIAELVLDASEESFEDQQPLEAACSSEQSLLQSVVMLHEAKVMSDSEFIAVVKRIAAIHS